MYHTTWLQRLLLLLCITAKLARNIELFDLCLTRYKLFEYIIIIFATTINHRYFIHTSTCMCVYMIMCFPLPCPGPGYWLLSRRVVPPPQSDHWKQLLSGKSTHPIRHEKGHHIVHVSHTKVRSTTIPYHLGSYYYSFIHTYILSYILSYIQTYVNYP